MKKPVVRVSDHAVLRYLERVRGMDIEAVRCEIGRAVDLSLEHPQACGVVAGGFSYKLRAGVVVTVVEQNRPQLRPGRRGARGERDD